MCNRLNILILTIKLGGHYHNQYLYDEFKYVKYISICTHDFIINYNNNSDFGYILIVNVDYPEYLPSLHKDLLLLAEKLVINKEKSQHLLFTIKELIDVTLDYYNKL